MVFTYYVVAVSRIVVIFASSIGGAIIYENKFSGWISTLDFIWNSFCHVLLFTLPVFVVERSLATLHLKNYERQYFWFFVPSIYALQIIVGFFISWNTYLKGNIFFIIFEQFCNLIALFVSFLIDSWGK
uniref:Uncharacterized protein n=1 Tax=Panagrolaimus sp. JU765 TaxID=591449 RepID=A0AC34QUC9_9BILA